MKNLAYVLGSLLIATALVWYASTSLSVLLPTLSRSEAPSEQISRSVAMQAEAMANEPDVPMKIVNDAPSSTTAPASVTLTYRDIKRQSVGSGSRASFDCSLASAQVEILICSDRQLANLDRIMAESYLQIRSEASGDERQNIIDNQREWLGIRDQQCPSPAAENLTESSLSDSVECLRLEVRKRISELARWGL